MISKRIASELPYLRRFARALSGSQQIGDAYVASALEQLLSNPSLVGDDATLRPSLYRLVIKVSEAAAADAATSGSPEGTRQGADERLGRLTPRARQAFLLVAVEQFTIDQAAIALETDASGVNRLLADADGEIRQQVATNVVIIEDEPLIAYDLERLVTDLGHRVIAVARTRTQAVEAVSRRRPGLVLADIQLADGSSGIDAVADIVRSFSVPTIFITAFPERLLTGLRPEPTFLVTKPFQPDHLRAVISQALFFDIRARALLAWRQDGAVAPGACAST